MKNIDPNKVSNFKNHQPSYHQHSTFCMKTKPNKRYFNGEVKRLNQQRIDNFCTEELKKENPALYYCRLGRKLPKKYQEKPKVQISPVNAFVPPQSKLSKEELNIQLEKEAEERKAKKEKAFKEQQEKVKERNRLEYNRRTAQKQQRLVHWCDANGPGNWKSIHSEEFENKYGAKKNKSYY